MTVFTSRVRSTYLRKRSNHEMVIITLAVLAALAVVGRIGHYERIDRENTARLAMAAYVHERGVDR